MSTHTTGPWHIADDVERQFPGYYSICSEPRSVEVAACEELADAQLVAAAPDLLEALKLFESEYIDKDAACHKGICSMERCNRCSRILAARAAIKKAEGK